MTIDEIYNSAMAGGYRPFPKKDGKPQLEKDVLQVGFWESCGKVEGWGESNAEKNFGRFNGENRYMQIWLFYMHEMIDALAEGKSVEDYLKTL